MENKYLRKAIVLHQTENHQRIQSLNFSEHSKARFEDRPLGGSILKDLKERMKGKVYFCKSIDCEGASFKRELKDTEISLSSAYRDINGNELHAAALKFSPKAYAYCEIEGDDNQAKDLSVYLALKSLIRVIK